MTVAILVMEVAHAQGSENRKEEIGGCCTPRANSKKHAAGFAKNKLGARIRALIMKEVESVLSKNVFFFRPGTTLEVYRGKHTSYRRKKDKRSQLACHQRNLSIERYFFKFKRWRPFTKRNLESWGFRIIHLAPRFTAFFWAECLLITEATEKLKSINIAAKVSVF